VVTSANGAARLEIPPNALASATAVTLRGATSVPLDPHAVQGAAFDVGPPGLPLSLPATLVLRYEARLGPSGVEETDLRLHGLGGGGQWAPVAGATTDAGAREARGSVSAAGTYGVVWSGPRVTCAGREDAQFDFWLGSWSYSAPGAFPGTNDITKEGGGCLVEEHFRDTSGSVGRSVSLFSRLDGQWHQTYIDSRGGRLVLVGRFDGVRMLLNETPARRFGWSVLDANTVRYYAEDTSDGGATWRVSFDSRYVRR